MIYRKLPRRTNNQLVSNILSTFIMYSGNEYEVKKLWIHDCGYTIIDICLWTYDYRYMVTMYSYFENRWTEPIQDNRDVIDMCYGYMLKNMIRQFLHKLECKIWIDIYCILRLKRPQCSWILLKGIILQQSWIQNMNRLFCALKLKW